MHKDGTLACQGLHGCLTGSGLIELQSLGDIMGPNVSQLISSWSISPAPRCELDGVSYQQRMAQLSMLRSYHRANFSEEACIT